MSTTYLSLLLERVRATPGDEQLVLAFADAVEADLLSMDMQEDPEDILQDYFGDDDFYQREDFVEDKIDVYWDEPDGEEV